MKIYCYSHPHFSFEIFSSNITSRQTRYVETLHKRGKDVPVCNVQINHQNQPLDKPIFFENSRYDFEFAFDVDVRNVQINHKLQAVNSAFRFNSRLNLLIGSLDVGNDLGWFHLPLRYELADGSIRTFDFAFEVLPSKMDLNSDLPKMYADIDEHYPLWRFNLAEKTAQSHQDSRKRVDFSLLWLAQFQRLQADFAKALNVIANSPHNRLQAIEKYQKAGKIKGKVPERSAMKIRNDMNNGLYHKRYAITEKRLSVDTPENRFVKMVVARSVKILANFNRTLRKENEKTDRLSETFFERLNEWQKPLWLFQQQYFMKQVGDFRGLAKESLVLQQRSGYQQVFQIWQELKHYLDVFERNNAEISQKSVAEIYEVWCFLALRSCLLKLGFNEKLRKTGELKLAEDFSLVMEDGIRGAFHFEKAGVQIRLAHEPRFSKKNQTITSFITTQKPDIFLEITFPNQLRYIWLFDAKYRIKTEQPKDENDDIEHIDYVPDDAINQMHRYRDALILLDKKQLTQKSRPVFGAFALYPGFFNQQVEENPYQNAIEEVGIGAFALLPTKNGDYWLTEFLREKLHLEKMHDSLWLHPEARIADHGMQQTRYTNLVFIIGLGENRSTDYYAQAEQGKLSWYHTPVSTFELKYPDYLASEIRFLALAYQGEIHRLYPVKSVKKLPRSQITFEQAGGENKSSENYYLFELAKPLRLEEPITGVPSLDTQGKGFRNTMKLTTLEKLDNVKYFTELVFE